MLGTSDYGAQVAAHFGIPYCFAHFITQGEGCGQALEIYRQHYQPSARYPKPTSTVCVWALMADTEEEADFQFMSRARTRLARDRGILVPVEPPEVAASHPYSARERARIQEMREQAFVGTPQNVGNRLRRLTEELGLDELVILTWTYELAARKRSYDLFAREFGI